MNTRTVYPIDLNFMGQKRAIAAYLIPHAHGAVLIESGPGSTITNLEACLKSHRLTPADITDVLLTHIHLDHAGAAGWLARHGARIHVHAAGAPHMFDPQRLLASAERIYGNMMDTLWGEFLPVPEAQLFTPQDGDLIEIDGLTFKALETPGHANHHFAYIFEDICFSGDIGGVRLTKDRHLRLPMPPPEFHLTTWRATIKRLQKEFERGAFQRIAPTHFGIYDDAQWHLQAVNAFLTDIESWILNIMPANPPIEQLVDQFLEWSKQQTIQSGVGFSTIKTYETVNPSGMSAYGIQRYWRKYLQPPES